MSTNNFSYENVLIAVPEFTFGGICEECEEKGIVVDCEHIEPEFDTFAYDEYVKEVQEQLKKIGFEACDKSDNDRNYGGTIIAEWGQEDNCFIKYLQVVIKNGYYSGANIDWTSDGDFCPENEQNKKEVAHIKALQNKFDRMVAKTEKILRKNGTELIKVAQFSNGEAIYETKKKQEVSKMMNKLADKLKI